jgi:hypothetical protein
MTYRFGHLAGRGPQRPPFVCSICGITSLGWSNDAWPINTGRCCHRCDEEIVLPARIVLAYRKYDHKKKKRPGPTG